MSQTVAPIMVHCALAVQPARHMKVRWSQMGAVVPQSEFVVHATHACVAVRHFGLAAGQSASALH